MLVSCIRVFLKLSLLKRIKCYFLLNSCTPRFFVFFQSLDPSLHSNMASCSFISCTTRSIATCVHLLFLLPTRKTRFKVQTHKSRSSMKVHAITYTARGINAKQCHTSILYIINNNFEQYLHGFCSTLAKQ